MSLPLGPIIGILADNLHLRKSVMPLSTMKATAWAKGLNLPVGGETVLYTGLMYQLMPYTSSMSAMTAMVDGTWITRTMGLGRIFNKFVNISRFMALPGRKRIREYNNRLRNIALLLKAAGVEFGYLYGKEPYAGALVHEQGMEDVFRNHACAVYRRLKESGVKRVITVDPHTTNVLRSIYPKFIRDYDLDVKSYIEVLAEADLAPGKQLGERVVIHDSCVYARDENMVNQPRLLLDKAGIHVVPTDNSGRQTICCGGPIESLFPAKSAEIASKRLEQLKNTETTAIVSMCPVCLLNLSHVSQKHGVTVCDLSEYLAEAYLVRS